MAEELLKKREETGEERKLRVENIEKVRKNSFISIVENKKINSGKRFFFENLGNENAE